MVNRTTNIITTFAGTGTAGYSGDGSLAISANLNSPYGVSVDTVNNLVYIADSNNNRIIMVKTPPAPTSSPALLSSCPSGYYLESDKESCTYCPARTYTGNTGASNISECISCPQGTFVVNPLTSPISDEYGSHYYYAIDYYITCIPCLSNTYSSIFGLNGSSSYSLSNQISYSSPCIPYPPGQISTTGFIACGFCPLGTYTVLEPLAM